MTYNHAGDKSFWQLFLEWQQLRKDKQHDSARKKHLEEKLGGYLIDTIDLRHELFMAWRLTPMNEPLKDVFARRLEHTQILEEERRITFDYEGSEFYDPS